MTLYNDYVITVLARQQQKELLAQAAQDRLARLVPRGRAPWWRRLLVSGTALRTSRVAGWRVQLPR